MFRRGRSFARVQRLGKKGGDFIDGLRALQEEIENGRRRRIQQVRIPGQRFEDDTIVVEIDDPQPFGDREKRAVRRRTRRG